MRPLAASNRDEKLRPFETKREKVVWARRCSRKKENVIKPNPLVLLLLVPVAGERGVQFSSYDRTTELVFGIKSQWFANDDSGHFIDTRVINGRRESVLAEIDGPGAIVRIWSANPEGTLRIYLDHASEPVIEIPFVQAVSGNGPYPFVEPFAGTRARGANIYFPFPFQSHALVTVQNPGKMYYHVNVVQYPEGTEVEAYKPELVDAHQATIDRVAARLSDPFGTFESSGAQTVALDLSLAPGESQSVQLTGPAAVAGLRLSVSASELDRALRETLITATWDDFDGPSIWSPIGDFFGGSPGLNPFESLPLGILADGTMYSHWYMPFGRSAVLEFVNEGDQVVEIKGTIAQQSIDWHPGLAYFHAKWRKETNVSNHRDWLVLSADGPGRFVGMTLSVMNPVRQWWGEGDEKVYVDGEAFPSTFGTGTEDYFGYAWSSNEIFTHAYHNQPRADGPDNFGRIINSRFHFLDNIPFQKRIRFDLEIWHWVGDAWPAYSAVAYWYSQSNADAFAPIPVEKRQIVEAPLWRLFGVDGAIEGEDLEILRLTAGLADPQHMGFFTTPENLWSNDSHLWWRGGNVGDALYLVLPVPEQGRYKVSGAFTKAGDYGKVQIRLNDEEIGPVLDFYDPHVVSTGEIFLGEIDLVAGSTILAVEIVGANERAVGHMFGLDYIKLEKIE